MEFALLVGRILFSAMFILSGITHFAQFNGMTEYAKTMGVPAPGFMVALTGLMILLGGIGVLLGYQAKIAAALLVIFLIPTAFIMHPFWKMSDPMQKAAQQAQFMKNLSMAGAALLIIYFGSGPMSVM